MPFFEEVVSQEQLNFKKSFVCLSQIEVNERRPTNQESTYSFKEVYIKGIAEEYQVIFKNKIILNLLGYAITGKS